VKAESEGRLAQKTATLDEDLQRLKHQKEECRQAIAGVAGA